MENLSLNSAKFDLTKSDRISLETSWFLKFEIWRVAVTISCNFFRYLSQVSHRNNQPLSFFNFLTWYEVWHLSSDIPLRISTNISLPEQVDFWHKSYTKNDICKLHLFPLSQMMSFVVSFCQGLSLNLISTLL